MKKTMILMTILSVMSIGLSGCNNEPHIAKVNGKKVSASEFETYLKFKRLPANDEKRKGKFLDQYLERKAMAMVIEKSDVLDHKMISAELEQFKTEMLISRYFEKFLRDKVTDQAVTNYYNANSAQYEEKKVHVAHILFRTNSKMDENERKAKLTTANEAYSKIMSGNEFAEVAKSYSEDKVSGKKGGDLGWLKEGAIDARFNEKVFAMEKGAISEPFESAFGYHIVKLIDGSTVIKRPLEAVKGDIRYILRNKAKAAELERVMSAMKISKQGS